MIVTYVSTSGMQMQSIKGKLRSNEVTKLPRHHIGHTNSHDKTILTRTFLLCCSHQLLSIFTRW